MRIGWWSSGRRAALAWVALAGLATTSCRSPSDAAPGEAAVQAAYEPRSGYVEVSYFYDAMAPYGRWVEVAPYGWCWTPYDISPAWRPYYDGVWVYTDFGWTWVSYEPWGWATYHYGRWLFDPHFGWVWVPGTVWGPAWVAWQVSDGWVGWAPLPPTASWGASYGLRFRGSRSIPSSHWCFVESRHLVDQNLSARVASFARNPTLLRRSRDVTRIESRGGRPVNRGLEIRDVEIAIGRRIPRRELVETNAPPGDWGRIGQGNIPFFRPEVRGSLDRGAPPPRVRKREAVPAPVMRQREAAERRRFDQALAQERARLENAHRRELQSAARGPGPSEVRKRQGQEKQAFERHARQQRQVLEERLRKRLYDQHAGPREAPKDREKGRDGGRGGSRTRDAR